MENTQKTNEMAKHTPGPWHIGARQPNSDKFIYGKAGEEVANCDRLTNFPEVNLANARLIASAPELLDALKASTKWLAHFKGYLGPDEVSEMGPVAEIIRISREVIRKAEGGNQ